MFTTEHSPRLLLSPELRRHCASFLALPELGRVASALNERMDGSGSGSAELAELLRFAHLDLRVANVLELVRRLTWTRARGASVRVVDMRAATALGDPTLFFMVYHYLTTQDPTVRLLRVKGPDLLYQTVLDDAVWPPPRQPTAMAVVDEEEGYVFEREKLDKLHALAELKHYHCAHLEIYCNRATWLDSAALRRIADNSGRYLRSLKIAPHMPWVERDALVHLVQRCPDLRHLRLEGSGAATDDAFMETLLLSCPLLESFATETLSVDRRRRCRRHHSGGGLSTPAFLRFVADARCLRQLHLCRATQVLYKLDLLCVARFCAPTMQHLQFDDFNRALDSEVLGELAARGFAALRRLCVQDRFTVSPRPVLQPEFLPSFRREGACRLQIAYPDAHLLL